MTTRIQQLFDRRKSEGKAVLVAYLTAGDPSAEATPGLVAALERGGADLIELGVPVLRPHCGRSGDPARLGSGA